MTTHRAKKKIGKRRQSGPRLPVWIILAGVAALAAGIVLAAVNTGGDPDFEPLVQGAPALTVDREMIDYGDIRLGTPVTTEFRVSNVGSKDLRFTKAPYVELKEGC